MSKLPLNAKVSDITKITQFFINFRNKLILFRKLKDIKLTKLAIKRASIFKQIYRNIIKM